MPVATITATGQPPARQKAHQHPLVLQQHLQIMHPKDHLHPGVLLRRLLLTSQKLHLHPEARRHHHHQVNIKDHPDRKVLPHHHHTIQAHPALVQWEHRDQAAVGGLAEAAGVAEVAAEDGKYPFCLATSQKGWLLLL